MRHIFVLFFSLLVDLVMKHPKFSSQALQFVAALGKSNESAR